VSSRLPALVVLNPAAHGGTALRRFEVIRAYVETLFEASIVVGQPDGAWTDEVRHAVDCGTRTFIAAGGDGTAHTLLNTLVAMPQRPPLDDIALGTIGLGSSNDLEKPPWTRISGLPVRLCRAKAAPRDLVRCRYTNGTSTHEECFLVSASLGLTACANARFGEATSASPWLRRMSTPLAITWAAARTVAGWRNLPVELRIDGGTPERVALSSLSVLKTEWLSGHLHFGHPVAGDSGDFDVALTLGLGRVQLAADVFALLRGQFDGRPGHRRLRAQALDVRLDDASPLEMDGEVVTARAVRFDMYPERIRLCA
jgi:diacylglycerol kinase (ATP)